MQVCQRHQNRIHDTDIGITTSRAKYPQYASYTSRLSTYDNTSSGFISQSAESLVRAGFFYTGTSDLVRCFYCGGGLRNWDRCDDPWTEHKRWFPKCDFLNTYSSNKKNEKSQYERSPHFPIYVNVSDEECTNTSVTPTIENLDYIIAAKAVLHLGYSKTEVTNAFQLCVQENKEWTHVTARQLLGKILELRETAHQQKLPVQDKSDENGNSLPFEESDSFIGIESENIALKQRLSCQVCHKSATEVAFLPCGHLVTCVDCAPAMKFCTTCQVLVKATVKVFLS